MPVVTFIFGLCGAGKSWLAERMANKGTEVLDEGYPGPPPGQNLSPQKYAILQQYLHAGKDCAVVEACLFHEFVRPEAEGYLRGIPDIEISWVDFEPDLATANHNCMHRENKGDGPGHVELNTRWVRDYTYTFPDGFKPTPIYKLPCKKGAACPVCNPPN